MNPELEAPMPMKADSGVRRETVRALVLALLSIALYANTLAFDYALDDGLVFTDNPIVLKGIAGLPEIFSRDTFYGVFQEKTPRLLPGGRYRPFTLAMFAMEYELFGLNPMIGHLVNVLLYAGLCVLIYRLLNRLLPPENGTRWYLSVPFLTALLFTAHPLHTEVVANIKGRDELVSLLGSVTALFFSTRYVEDRRFLRLIFSFAAFSVLLSPHRSASADP